MDVASEALMRRVPGAARAAIFSVFHLIARRATILSGAVMLALICSAHVGSPDVFFEGKAGPYPVRVIIRSPAVIPAQAEIIARVTGDGIRRVTATARAWGADDKNAPPPDNAVRVAGDTTLWTLQLWMMRQGPYAVVVHVDGAAGDGTVTVPYTAVAQRVLGMNRGEAIALSAAAIFLVAGMLTIIGAAAGEAMLTPGEAESEALRARTRRVRLIAAAIVVIILVGGRVWWAFEDRAYAAAVFRPSAARVTVRDDTSAVPGRPVRRGHVELHPRVIRFCDRAGPTASCCAATMGSADSRSRQAVALVSCEEKWPRRIRAFASHRR